MKRLLLCVRVRNRTSHPLFLSLNISQSSTPRIFLSVHFPGHPKADKRQHYCVLPAGQACLSAPSEGSPSRGSGMGPRCTSGAAGLRRRAARVQPLGKVLGKGLPRFLSERQCCFGVSSVTHQDFPGRAPSIRDTETQRREEGVPSPLPLLQACACASGRDVAAAGTLGLYLPTQPCTARSRDLAVPHLMRLCLGFCVGSPRALAAAECEPGVGEIARSSS